MIKYFRRLLWLSPVILTALLCMYFINIFQRLDNALLHRQIDERDTIVEFSHFIKTQSTLYVYTDLLDRFEDNNIYLLDNELQTPLNKRHTRKCPYSLNREQHPYEIKEYINLMLKNKNGDFIHRVNSDTIIDFKFKHLIVEGTEYILLAGVHNYPKLPEEKELHFAIGLLLVFVAFCNWIVVAYTKHLRLTYRPDKN